MRSIDSRPAAAARSQCASSGALVFCAALAFFLPEPLRADFQVNTSAAGSQRAGAVTADGQGIFTVVWESSPPPAFVNQVYARRFDATGAPLGSEFAVSAPIAIQPRASAAPDGSLIVAWSGQPWIGGGFPPPDGDGSAILAQRLDKFGLPAGIAFVVNTFTKGYQSTPVVASDAAGNFVIAWQSSEQDGSGTGVFAQRFAADGTRLGEEFQVNTYTDNHQGDNALAVAMAPDGRFVVTWRSIGQDDGNPGVGGGGLYAQRFAANGAPSGAEFRIPIGTAGEQAYPGVAVAFDPSGGFVAVWPNRPELCCASGNSDILGRRFDASGRPVSGEFRVDSDPAQTNVGSPELAMDAAGNFLVVYEGVDGDGVGIFARYFARNATPLGRDFRVNVETSGNQHSPKVAADPDGNFFVVWTSECDGSGPKCEQVGDGDRGGVFARRFSTSAPTCPPSPEPGCLEAGKSKIQMSLDRGGSFSWTWGAGPGSTAAEYGQPAEGLTHYAVCLYEDGDLVAEAHAPADGKCDDGLCWRASPGGKIVRYRNPVIATGTTAARLKAGGPGRAQMQVKARGLDFARVLPIGPFETMTTQLRNGDGSCWQSEHRSPAKVNDENKFVGSL
jgi:hypothetical protein